MTLNATGTLWTIALVIGIAVLAVGGYVAFRPLLEERARLERKRDALRHDNEAMNAQIVDLKQKQAAFQDDPEFVEQVGRAGNRVRPNEMLFVFPRGRRPPEP